MIKQFILFILLSLGSVTTAFAIPTVSEIESTIASGDYKEAKSKLNEVLKVHPDSVVANKYMLEIIKIEYAGSLQPSVEFKIYEDKLKQIEVKKQQKILQEQEALAAKKRAEFKAKVKSFFNFILILCIFAIVFYFLYLVFIKHYNKIVENMKHAKWKAKVVSETNHFNTIFSKHLEKPELIVQKYDQSILNDMNYLHLDNTDFIKALVLNDVNVNTLNRHIKNTYDFLDRYGFE